MPLSFKNKLRILKQKEPELYEAVSSLLKKSLFESEFDSLQDNNSDPFESDDNQNKVTTPGMKKLMDVVTQDVGAMPDKKHGTDIYSDNDNVDTATAIPEQDPLGYGIQTSESPQEENPAENTDTIPEENTDNTTDTLPEENTDETTDTQPDDTSEPLGGEDLENINPFGNDFESQPVSVDDDHIPDGE